MRCPNKESGVVALRSRVTVDTSSHWVPCAAPRRCTAHPLSNAVPVPPASDFYLRDLARLAAHARERCQGLLDADQLQRLDVLTQLPERACRLYLRLAMRKGVCFRADQLDYREIDDVDAAAAELVSAGLLTVNEGLSGALLVSLLTVTELASLLGSRRRLRSELEVELRTRWPDDELGVVLVDRFSWYRVVGRDLLDLLCVLYFGNGAQHLATFIIADLGHQEFERYTPSGAPPFSNRAALLAYLETRRLAQAARVAIASGAVADALRLAARLITAQGLVAADSEGGGRLRHRFESVLLDLSRCLERAGRPHAALALTSLVIGDAGKRQHLLLVERHLSKGAASAAARRTVSDTAEPALRRTVARLRGSARPDAAPIRAMHLNVEGGTPVEVAALTALRPLGFEGAHLENQMPAALVMLLFWDVFFAPIDGAFHSPFQHGPVDLHDVGFYQRRAHLIGPRLNAMDSGEIDVGAQLTTTWHAKRGRANPLLAWDLVPHELLLRLVGGLTPVQVAAICARLLSNVQRHRRGFPDLSVHDGTRTHFLEVKSPNDQLQPHQAEWLQFLASAGIAVAVLHARPA